jgi:UDP-glucose 4-epimerase
MENVIVTGGCGFIGSRVSRLLQENGDNVTALDINPNNTIPNVRVRQADIRDYLAVDRACRDMDTVMHLAAVVGVPLSLENPTLFWEVNTTGTLNVLEAARKRDVERFFYASSNAVYGQYPALKEGIPENYPKKPANPYGASKLAAEALVGSYQESYGLNTVTVRWSNVYGPNQQERNVVWIFIERALEGEPLYLHGGGQQGRDFTYVDDVARGGLEALERGREGEIYNISSGETKTVRELAEIIKRETPSTQLIEKPKRPGDATQGALNIAKAREELGYRPRYSLEEGVKACVEWFRGAR